MSHLWQTLCACILIQSRNQIVFFCRKWKNFDPLCSSNKTLSRSSLMLKNALNWYWAVFAVQHTWSISDGQIDELAVLGKSLDSVGCSLSLDSLTETRLVGTARHPLSSHWHVTKPITTPIMSSFQIIMLTLWPWHLYHARIVLCAWYSLLCSKLCPPNQHSPIHCVGESITNYTRSW